MKKLRNYVMCLRSARSVGFSEVFGPLTRGSFCTAVFPTPHPCDLNSGFLKRWGNWGGYRGIAKKRSGRQAFFPLSLPCTAFELASLVLPQRVLGTRAPCLQVRPKPTNWLSHHFASLLAYYSEAFGCLLTSQFSSLGKGVPILELWSISQTGLRRILSVLAFVLSIFPPQTLWLVDKCFLNHISIFSSICPLPFKVKLLKKKLFLLPCPSLIWHSAATSFHCNLALVSTRP